MLSMGLKKDDDAHRLKQLTDSLFVPSRLSKEGRIP